jgi:hypothetical protein
MGKASKCGDRKGSALTIATANDGAVTRAFDLGRCLALTCSELSSSLQASFGEIDVALDGTKDFVIDRFLVA